MNGLALLFGNARYEALPSLRTPVSDVRNLTEVLERIGFEVLCVENASLREMVRAIASFRSRLANMTGGKSIFVYYAGHGIQADGENFLLPVDTGVENEEWRRASVTLTTLFQDLCRSSHHQKLIVLDACRTNGISASGRSNALGLTGVSAHSYDDIMETMVLYATRPGCVASDGADVGASPLCRALIASFLNEPTSLVHLASDIASSVTEFTQGQQDPWFLGNLRRHTKSPFWTKDGDPAPIAPQPNIARPSREERPVHKFASPGDAIVASMGHLVHKIRAKDTTGRWAYYFVLVEPQREAEFLSAIQGAGILNVQHYGSVVASCYGREPTPEVRSYLYRRYGWVV